MYENSFIMNYNHWYESDKIMQLLFYDAPEVLQKSKRRKNYLDGMGRKALSFSLWYLNCVLNVQCDVL